MTVDLDEIRQAREEADCLCSAEDVDQAPGRPPPTSPPGCTTRTR